MPFDSREKLNQWRRDYYQKNRAKICAEQKAWKKKNPEKACYYQSSYYKRARRDFVRKPLVMLVDIKRRLRGQYKNRNILLQCSKEEFLDFVFNKTDYPLLFKNWEDSNYENALTPCIDRIDNKGHYNLNNMQVITKSQNTIKRNYIDYALPY